MSVKIKDIKTKMIKEDEGYSIACSALGVYSTGKNLQDAKKNYLKALELHLSVLREKATEAIVIWKSPIHGKELIKILCNQFNFQPIRQKGSHVTITNGTIYVTVPLKEIRVGLEVILSDCSISGEQFLKV